MTGEAFARTIATPARARDMVSARSSSRQASVDAVPRRDLRLHQIGIGLGVYQHESTTSSSTRFPPQPVPWRQLLCALVLAQPSPSALRREAPAHLRAQHASPSAHGAISPARSSTSQAQGRQLGRAAAVELDVYHVGLGVRRRPAQLGARALQRTTRRRRSQSKTGSPGGCRRGDRTGCCTSRSGGRQCVRQLNVTFRIVSALTRRRC